MTLVCHVTSSGNSWNAGNQCRIGWRPSPINPAFSAVVEVVVVEVGDVVVEDVVAISTEILGKVVVEG